LIKEWKTSGKVVAVETKRKNKGKDLYHSLTKVMERKENRAPRIREGVRTQLACTDPIEKKRGREYSQNRSSKQPQTQIRQPRKKRGYCSRRGECKTAIIFCKGDQGESSSFEGPIDER